MGMSNRQCRLHGPTRNPVQNSGWRCQLVRAWCTSEGQFSTTTPTFGTLSSLADEMNDKETSAEACGAVLAPGRKQRASLQDAAAATKAAAAQGQRAALGWANGPSATQISAAKSGRENRHSGVGLPRRALRCYERRRTRSKGAGRVTGEDRAARRHNSETASKQCGASAFMRHSVGLCRRLVCVLATSAVVRFVPGRKTEPSKYLVQIWRA